MDQVENVMPPVSIDPQPKQQDGSGHPTPARGAEESRIIVEPDPNASIPHDPIQTMKGDEGNAMTVQDDGGMITAAERANEA